MIQPLKPQPRKRTVMGWRQMEQRRRDVRSKHRPPPAQSSKREG